MSTYCVRAMLMRLKEVHSLLMQVYCHLATHTLVVVCMPSVFISKKVCVLVYTMQDMFTRLKSIDSPYSHKHNTQW